MAKHVKETLGQYLDWEFFSVLEAKKEEPVDEKKMKSEEEKEGLDVIKKLQDNLERFKSAAGDKIIKYKEFWKENQEMKDKFDEGGSLYKLFDSDYVVGVLNLPDEALSEEEINAQIEEVDKEKEGEEKEEGGEGSTEHDEETETPEEEKEESQETQDKEKEEGKEKHEVKESLNEEEGLDLDLDEKPEEETFEQPELGGEEETPEFAEPEGEEETPEGEEFGGEETPEGEEEEGFTSEEPETKEFFAVFDMTGSEREEVFRTDNPSVIKQFTDFFENSFKACMKEQIAKFKQAQEDKRNEAELKAKEKQREERKGKLDNFLKKA
jgi:hypothetical protein